MTTDDEEINARIETFLEDHQVLKAMPESSVRILKLLSDPNFRTEQLLKLIKQDAVIAAKIMQVVNSAAYARPNRITQLARATVYLGVNTVKEIVTATAISAACKPATIGKYNTRDLWDHSVGVAVLCREFAIRTKVLDTELAFLAGILHDIGLLLSAQSEVESTEEVFIDAEDSSVPFEQVERTYFGFDHCQLGVRLAKAWKFPDEVAAVINWHHSPQLAPDIYRQICALVFVADTLCAEAKVGFQLTTVGQKVNDDSITAAGLTRADVNEVMAHFKVLLRLHTG